MTTAKTPSFLRRMSSDPIPFSDRKKVFEIISFIPKVRKNNRSIEYLNFPNSFDIETTSTKIGDNERAFMYIWQFGLNGAVIYGRRWEEFIELLQMLQEQYDLNENRRIVVYVHNLSYEFQFIRKLFSWYQVFSTNDRTPVYALCEYGVEFRCSYMLTGKSLEKVGNDLQKYKVKKLTGYLNYSEVRTSDTELTSDELAYCINDVKVVMALIQEKIEQDGSILNIPLTKTSYVRKYCRNNCLHESSNHRTDSKKFKNYRKLMDKMPLTKDRYRLLKKAFQGGFTHANYHWVGKTLENIHSFDFSSSYPFVMLSRKFPMNGGEEIQIHSKEELEKNLECYCCLMVIELFNVIPKLDFDHPISSSKCDDLRNWSEDNGRIIKAEHMTLTITEQDYFIYREFYSWTEMRIHRFIRYERDYLPTDLVKAIVKLYLDKTMLKGVKGKEVDYALSKELLNSTYGMAATSPVRNEIIYDNDNGWGLTEADIDKQLEKYNKSINRFLSFEWSIWITAYARSNLFTGIKEFGYDYVYSDTDSIKVFNVDSHIEYIEKYNANCKKMLQKAFDRHGLDIALTHPKSIDGVEHPIGVWSYEGMYTRFKTLGAKRYVTEQDGKQSITIAGLSKKKPVAYMIEHYGSVFDALQDGMHIPAEWTGKLTHKYFDEEFTDTVTDIQGHQTEVHELSYIHMSPCEFTLSLSSEFWDLLQVLRVMEVKG